MNNFNKQTADKNSERESPILPLKKKFAAGALAIVALGGFAAGNAKHEILEGSSDIRVAIDGEIGNPTDAVDAAIKQLEDKTGVESTNQDDVNKAISEGTKLRADGTVHPGDAYSVNRYSIDANPFGEEELRILDGSWESSDDIQQDASDIAANHIDVVMNTDK